MFFQNTFFLIFLQRFYEAEGSSQVEEKRSSVLQCISDWLSLVPFDFLEIDMAKIWDIFGCDDEIFRSISDEWIEDAQTQHSSFVCDILSFDFDSY